MRSWVVVLVSVLAVMTGCSSGSDEPAPAPADSTSAPATVTLESIGVDWPRTTTLDAAEPPAAPKGFDDRLVSRMAEVLTDWAQATTVDPDVWHAAAPARRVAAALPAEVASMLDEQTAGAVSPRLAVANVLGPDVTVVGEPRVTTAWKATTKADEFGASYLQLELQTRAAYEVRVGDDGPTRVIGVLRVHGLTAYPATTDDFGVTTGWQEFGAGDCALALDDQLVPDDDLVTAKDDLATFVDVGDQDAVRMPALGSEEKVDAAYRQRCRDSAT